MPLPMRNLIARLALSLSLKDIFVYPAHSRTPLWSQKVLHFFWYGMELDRQLHTDKKYERANLIYLHVSQCFWVLYGHFEKEILPVGTGLSWSIFSESPWSIFPNLSGLFLWIFQGIFLNLLECFFESLNRIKWGPFLFLLGSNLGRAKTLLATGAPLVEELQPSEYDRVVWGVP